MFNFFPELAQSFTKEIKERVDTYFAQLYNQPPDPTMSVDEVISLLKSFKDSHDKENRDVLACTLHHLFEEFKYFPKYEDRELQIAAQLLGAIIDNSIVTHGTLGIALQKILQSLGNEPNTSMYLFGVTALDSCKTKIKEYPQFCIQMMQIPHFWDLPVQLIEMNPLANVENSVQPGLRPVGSLEAQNQPQAMANHALAPSGSSSKTLASKAQLQKQQQLRLQQDHPLRLQQDHPLRLQQGQQLRLQQGQQLRLQQGQQLRLQQGQQLRLQQGQQLRLQQEQQLRLQQEQQLRLQQEQQLRLQQEQQLRLQQEQQLRLQQEQQLRLQQEQQLRLQQEQQLRLQQEQQLRLQQEQQLRLQQEQQLRLQQEQQLRLQQEQQLKLQKLRQEQQLQLKQEQKRLKRQLKQRKRQLEQQQEEEQRELEQQLVNAAESENPEFYDVKKTFCQEVEDKATAFFQLIFCQPPAPAMGISDALDILKCLKLSHDQVNKDVCECIVRILLQEFKFLPQYPARELQLMAQLYGGVIEYDIVSDWEIRSTLRNILEALRLTPNYTIFHFGVLALDRFKHKLTKFSDFCHLLKQIPHVMQIPPQLLEYVRYGIVQCSQNPNMRPGMLG